MASAESTNTALAKNTYGKITELENELRLTIRKKKSLFDKAISALRSQLRDAYRLMLFQDHDLAISFEVDQNLWKTCFYKFIEDFRKRFRKAAQTETKEDDLRKLTEAFRHFLASANRFYTQLLQSLQAEYKLVLDGSIQLMNESVPNWRCYLTYHRCLIFLGDLARYNRDAPAADPNTILKDWLNAGNYYRQALALWPDNGNPHNQMAVLAAYVHDYCNSVYRYFRCLHSKTPFLTARENLNNVFDKVREKVKIMGARFDPPPHTRGRKGDKKFRLVRTSESNEELLRNLLVGFCRLHGILFTRVSLEKFSNLKAVVLKDLESLLRRNALPTSYILRMFAINIFSVRPPAADSSNPSPNDRSQQQAKSEAQQYATKFSIEFFGRVLHAFCQSTKKKKKSPSRESDQSNSDEERSPRPTEAVIKTEPMDNAHPPAVASSSSHSNVPERFINTEEFMLSRNQSDSSEILGAIGIFMDWLSSTRAEGLNVMQPPVQEKRAWTNMWKSIAKLLNYLSSSVENIQTSTSHERNTPLPEEAELRGFVPLASALSRLHFRLIPNTLNIHVLEDPDLVYRVRAAKIYRFGLLVVNQNLNLLFQSAEKKFSARPFAPKNQLSLTPVSAPAVTNDDTSPNPSVSIEKLQASVTETSPSTVENKREGLLSTPDEAQQSKDQSVLLSLDDLSRNLAKDMKQIEEDAMELQNEGSEDEEEVILFHPGRLDDQIADEQLQDITSTKTAIGSERGGSYLNDGKVQSYSPSHSQGFDLFSNVLPRDAVNRSLFSSFGFPGNSIANKENQPVAPSESNDEDLSEDLSFPFSSNTDAQTFNNHNNNDIHTTSYWASFLHTLNDKKTPTTSSFFANMSNNTANGGDPNGWSMKFQDGDELGSTEMTIENPFQRSYDALTTEEQREMEDSNARELQSLRFLFTPFSAEQNNISNLFSTTLPFTGSAKNSLVGQYQQQSVTAPATRNPFIS
eukprot:TRINITY_DN9659_c0_g1_i1.p1 TRINITY_DN9659_c0_g1~~TRINITY_DN9659_c0_g1_i1.p1  ORF type:complete len:985 (+),score=220.51 TRINITY_DN9659_c0_g1_i1:44-2956(+)